LDHPIGLPRFEPEGDRTFRHSIRMGDGMRQYTSRLKRTRLITVDLVLVVVAGVSLILLVVMSF
jgi:hypothetical protein